MPKPLAFGKGWLETSALVVFGMALPPVDSPGCKSWLREWYQWLWMGSAIHLGRLSGQIINSHPGSDQI